MNLEALASVMRAHRFLARGLDPAASALCAVPALADGLPTGSNVRLVAHALDALAPAAERLISTAFAEADAGQADTSGQDDIFVTTLRDLIGVGAQVSPEGGTLAVMQAARAVSDAVAHPSSRLAPIVARLLSGPDEERGRISRLVGRAVTSRATSALAAASAAGWRMPDYASALVASPLPWLFGRGTLEEGSNQAMVAAHLGSPLPGGVILGAETALRLVLTEVAARWSARKPKPEDQVLLLRVLTPALMDAGVDAMTRAALSDPDVLAAVLPQLGRFTDARALTRAGVDKSVADALLRPDTGLAVASTLIDVAAELRRWDVHSLLVASMERAAAASSVDVASFGPRRRVLQAATVALASRAGSGLDRPYGSHVPPAGCLVADHGAVVFVVFAGVAEACGWALDVVEELGDKVSVGVGFGRVLGGTDGSRVRVDGPSPQGALSSLRAGRVGTSASAADELAQVAPGSGHSTESRISCLIGATAVNLELVSGATGIFEIVGASVPGLTQPSARPAPVPAPIRSTPDPRATDEPASGALRRPSHGAAARAGAGGFEASVDPFRLAASGPPATVPDLYWDESPTSVQAVPPPRVATPTVRGETRSPIPPDRASGYDALDEVTMPGASMSFEALPDDAVREPTETGGAPPPAPSAGPLNEAMFEESFPFTLDAAGDAFAVPAELQEPTDGGLGEMPEIETPFRSEHTLVPMPAFAPPTPGPAVAPAAEALAFDDPFQITLPEPEAPAAAIAAAPMVEIAESAPSVAEVDAGPGGFDFGPPSGSDLGAVVASAPPDFAAPGLQFPDFGPADPPAAPASAPPPSQEVDDLGALFGFSQVVPAPAPPVVAAPEVMAPVVSEVAARALAAPAIDLGMDDFSFDLGGEHDLTDPQGLGRRVAPNAAMLSAFGFERTDDDETHLERTADEASAPVWNPNVEPGHAFDMEVEEEEGPSQAADEPTSLFQESSGFSMFAPEEEVASAANPAKTEPPSEPVARRGKPVAMDFDHLFRGYCFYLERERAVFGRPYGSRMVDRHAYPFGGDVEDAYRAFLQDKIKEGFVPQTDLAGEVPPSTTLLPLNLERLGRAWSRLT